MFPTFSLTGFVLRFHWMYTNLAIGAFYWKEAAKEEIMTETGRRGLHGHDRIHGSSLLSQIEAPVRHCRLLNPAIVADFFWAVVLRHYFFYAEGRLSLRSATNKSVDSTATRFHCDIVAALGLDINRLVGITDFAFLFFRFFFVLFWKLSALKIFGRAPTGEAEKKKKTRKKKHRRRWICDEKKKSRNKTKMIRRS